MRRTRALLYQTETLKIELLNTPVQQLALDFKGTIFSQAIPVVKEELRRAGITQLEPVFYISTGYGCIAGQPLIALGFYDFHPLLKELNEEFRGWRYTDADIFDLLRHECGHAFCYSYKLYRRKDFRRLFDVRGHFFNTYPEADEYDYNPWSRSYVNPNGDHYAQKHPDEDFAETFTVWLTPRSGWRKAYQRYPTALQKLRYTDRLVKEIGGEAPLVQTDPGWMMEPYEQVKLTVAEFMNASVAQYAESATGYLDPDLRELFRSEPRAATRRALFRDYQRAEALLKEQKQIVLSRVSYWVGVDSTVVFDLFEKMIARVRTLNLWVERAQIEKKVVEMTAYVTVLCTNYKNRGTYF